MTTIFCSGKLEKFLGKVDVAGSADSEPLLGNWNGHSTHVDRKRCLIFLNSKTCYVVLITAVVKKDLGNFADFFKERLVHQLTDDFKLPEGKEVQLRRELSNIKVAGTNNNKNVLATMNKHVQVLPYYLSRFGPVENWDELSMSYLLNEVPCGANVWARKKKYQSFDPREAMGELLSAMSNDK
jgi:hypothetical protein